MRPIAMKIAMLIFIAMDRNWAVPPINVHKHAHLSVMEPYRGKRAVKAGLWARR